MIFKIILPFFGIGLSLYFDTLILLCHPCSQKDWMQTLDLVIQGFFLFLIRRLLYSASPCQDDCQVAEELQCSYLFPSPVDQIFNIFYHIIRNKSNQEAGIIFKWIHMDNITDNRK